MEVCDGREIIRARGADVTVEFEGAAQVAVPQVVLADLLSEGRNVDGWVLLPARLVDVAVTDGVAFISLEKGVG